LDLQYPDFTARHVFTAKLRLVIIVGFWALCLFFYPGLLTLDQPIMLIISLTFVVTTICYAFILRGIWPVFFFIIELAADVAAQTVLVYLTGGPNSNFFTIYIIYCAAGGLFYNYRVSAVISVLALFFYSLLLIATRWHWIEPFSYPFREVGLFAGLGTAQNAALLTIFLAVAIYGIWIASHFTQLRERALERKNRELIALNRVSSTTRSVITLERVMSEIVRGVREGLGYEAAFLLYQDREEGKIKVFVPEESPYVKEIEKIWGVSLNQLYLPIDDQMNQVYQAMQKKKLIIRYELAEVMRGTIPPIPREQSDAVQRRFGFQKFAAAPLVAEGKVLGALIGVSRELWIEAEAIRTFEGFADQAALTIDNAMLIAELKRKNIELERVSRIKTEFLATMSHELRTPLTAIIGFSELLLEEVMGHLTADQRESLREVLVNGENLLHLINGLLDLAKIESGKMELSIGPVSMIDLLERVQRMIASLVQKKGHHLEIEIERSFPLIYADERKVQQILLNLLSNAIKFTPDGGRIRVAVLCRQRGGQGEELEVSVADNGVGIQKEDLKTIFESFRQADSSYTREYQGTGLGLALVKQFVELHGGKIWVESEPGKGSTFTFSIPSRRP
jgi:signal transduction histidine kinase